MTVSVRIVLTAIVLPAFCSLALAGPPATAPAKGQRVYTLKIEPNKPAGPEWSENKAALTPKGARPYLGTFENDSVTLSLKDLPAHQAVRVSLDLFIMRTWDGTLETTADGTMKIGPDYFNIDVENGPRLLRDAFCNGEPKSGRLIQTFPSVLPSDRNLPRAGAAQNDVLGEGEGVNGDAVYRLTFIFPHAADKLAIRFWADGLQGDGDEVWGLADVTVDALADGDIPAIDKAALLNLAEELVAPDHVKAREALWALVAQGRRAVSVLEEVAARPAAPRDPAKVEEVKAILAKLDDDAFDVREKAGARLRQIAPEVAPILRDLAKTVDSPEVQQRIEGTLKTLEAEGKLVDPESRRAARIARAMELINGRPAAKGE